MFLTQSMPDFFVAEHYGLRNTSSWWSKNLASARSARKKMQLKRINHKKKHVIDGQ
jgi:hypothetical protein